MKVAIIYPEVYDIARFKEKRKEFPPFGVLYLSAVIEKANHQVHVFKVSDGHESLDLRGFDAIALSIPSSATFRIMKKARFQSKFSGNPLIMIGGVHVNFYPEQSLKEFQADVAGVGECEETILELLEQSQSREFAAIRGVLYKSAAGIVRTAARTLMKNIDDLPLPARHLFPYEDLFMSDRLADTNTRMAHVMFSRGCPYPCRFCAAGQTRIQYRSGSNARHELVHLIDKYKVDGFAVVDDNFVVNKSKVIDICTKINDLRLRWSALSRVDTVDENLLKQMHAAGCIEIKFGVESGSQRILDAMSKRTTPERIRATLVLAQQVGIKSKIFIIHGFPGENKASTLETIRLLEELRPFISRVSLFRFVPLPGTYVYEHPEEFHLRGTDRDPNWNGNWERYHIHHNNRHWWGTVEEFNELNESYSVLQGFVDANWPAPHAKN